MKFILRPVGQAVKTPPFHGGNTSSILVRVTNGSLAQLGEHLPYKQRVTGSSPVTSTKRTTLRNQGGFCFAKKTIALRNQGIFVFPILEEYSLTRIDELSIIYLVPGSLAQLGEHLPYKQRVTGSSPVTSTNKPP